MIGTGGGGSGWPPKTRNVSGGRGSADKFQVKRKMIYKK